MKGRANTRRLSCIHYTIIFTHVNLKRDHLRKNYATVEIHLSTFQQTTENKADLCNFEKHKNMWIGLRHKAHFFVRILNYPFVIMDLQ